nr:unnamed protein product [Digitaria exilis]
MLLQTFPGQAPCLCCHTRLRADGASYASGEQVGSDLSMISVLQAAGDKTKPYYHSPTTSAPVAGNHAGKSQFPIVLTAQLDPSLWPNVSNSHPSKQFSPLEHFLSQSNRQHQPILLRHWLAESIARPSDGFTHFLQQPQPDRTHNYSTAGQMRPEFSDRTQVTAHSNGS